MKQAMTLTALLMIAAPVQGQRLPTVRAKVETGTLEGIPARDRTDVDRYLGIPFAAPPTGALRWREPQPAAPWHGIRKAAGFGPRCMQLPLFSDMAFRSPPSSEDCLYLNIWTPPGAAGKPGAKLPVLLYIYGGGFQAGDASEKRYDGAALAERGAIVVTANYRLNVFGFLAHPTLTAESPFRASGNYGLLDQAAALAWVKRNIASFGGDPAHITIGGESAGSMAVSAMMASPLTRTSIVGAIGESGAMMGNVAPTPHKTAEAHGTAFAKAVGAPTLADLRALPADRLLSSLQLAPAGFGATIDGHMLVEPPEVTFAQGRQAKVPLLAGTNSQEGGYQAIFGDTAPTLANYRPALTRLYGADADRIAALYPVASEADVIPVATALASDRFLSWSTWQWGELQRRAGAPTFIYQFRRVRPRALVEPADAPRPWGAVHSAEIEYALGNLAVNPAYVWSADDTRVSRTMTAYWSNFVRTGDPNGDGLARWPSAVSGDAVPYRQLIDVATATEPYSDSVREAAMTAFMRPR